MQPAHVRGDVAFAGKGGIGFLDANGAVALAPRYQQANGFFEGLALVAVKGKGGEPTWGHVDRHGEFVVKPIYRATNRFRGGLAAVQRGRWWGFVDKTGAEVVEPRYRAAQQELSEDRAWVLLP